MWLMSVIHTFCLRGDELADSGATSSNHHGRAAAWPAEENDNEASPKRARLSPDIVLEYEFRLLMEEAPGFNDDDAMPKQQMRPLTS